MFDIAMADLEQACRDAKVERPVVVFRRLEDMQAVLEGIPQDERSLFRAGRPFAAVRGIHVTARADPAFRDIAAPPAELRTGDVVVLASGGQRMTVTDPTPGKDGWVEVSWFDGGEQRHAKFQAGALLFLYRWGEAKEG